MTAAERLRTALAALALALGAATAAAQELKVLTAGAIKPLVAAVAADWQARGVKVAVQNDTAGALLKRLQGLFARLGLADAVAAKSVLVPGGLTGLSIVQGQADLAIQQASELAIVDGVVLVGMLPAEIQNFTTSGWALARPPGAADPAEAFVAALVREVQAGTRRGLGIEPPR